jgi:hypothetical protein
MEIEQLAFEQPMDQGRNNKNHKTLKFLEIIKNRATTYQNL